MRAGTVLFDSEFVFTDGQKGKKLIVLLNDGSNGCYIVVKTTSNDHRYNVQYGCQVTDRFPNYFLPNHASCLKKHTWIQLEEFFDYNRSDLDMYIISGRIKQIAQLDLKHTRDLLSCSLGAEDINSYQVEVIQSSLGSIRTQMSG